MKKITVYDEITEHLLREIFYSISLQLGFTVISSRTTFPDYILKKNGKYLTAEVEMFASNFFSHHHPVDECDIIICYENDLSIEISSEFDKKIEILVLHPYIEIRYDKENEIEIKRIRKLNWINWHNNKNFSPKHTEILGSKVKIKKRVRKRILE